VRKHLPWFRLADPLADRDVTLRDLLCHRAGLARDHDLLLYHAPWSPEETARRMAFLPVDHPFRSRFEYSNLGYVAAGHVLSKAAGEPWTDVMRRRLLGPLGMKGACFTRAEVLKAADRATPHRREGGKVVPLDWTDDGGHAEAATGLKCSARDLGAWLRFQLGDGAFEGKRLVSAAALAETHAPQVTVPLEPDRPKMMESTQMSYGLGWRRTDYRGHLLYEHNGNTDGFRARVLVFPQDRLAVAVLANADEYGVVHALAHLLADKLLGLPARDWHGHYLAWQQALDAEPKERAERFAKTRRPGTRPSRELEAYAGRYEDAAYGDVTVTAARGRLRLTWRSWSSELSHFHFDTFLLGGEPGPLMDAAVQFELRTDGEVGWLRVLGRTFTRQN
jgi:CubicO group peptidase (beta-lactamase class C family)